MKKLFAGFGREDITPKLGIRLEGYFALRRADAVLDTLEVNALALQCSDTTVVLLSLDLCFIKKELTAQLRAAVSRAVGLPVNAVHMHTTHTHTGPIVEPGTQEPLEQEYIVFLQEKMVAAAKAALADLKPASMGWAVGKAENVAFVRRFRMRDGSVRTNPGVNNPDIVEPIGAVDERVNVLRFDQEGGESLVLVNFGNHPDVVGGCSLSCDWPGFLRRTVEKALDGTKCIFFNGVQGDVNHVNVHPKGGDLNDMFMDFDDVSRGYGHARHIGQAVAGAVLQVFAKVAYTDVDAIRLGERSTELPSNMPKPEDMPMAYHIHALHEAGRDSELPFEGMLLTTAVAEAGRMIRLEHGPESFPITLNGIAIGPVVLIMLPGEPFTGVGRGLKQTEGFDLILPCCCADGYEGYFPMQDSYAEGGYEAKSSPYAEGVAEQLIQEGQALLKSLC